MSSKVFGPFLAGLVYAAAHGATSDHLFAGAAGTFNGAAGNVVFNGQQFVVPVVMTNTKPACSLTGSGHTL